MITSQLMLWLALAASSLSLLPPAAQEHHDRAIVHLDAGDRLAAVDEFERAYAALPDPVAQRSERGALMGSIRGTLLDLYDASHDPAHLVRLQALQLRHRDELQAALGPDATPEATSGTQASIDEVEAELQRVQPAPLLPAPTPATKPEPAPTTTPAPLHGPAEAEANAASRRRRHIGGALLGISALPIVATIASAAVYADRYRAITKQGELIDTEGGVATDRQVATALKYHHDGQIARTVAIVSGSLGAALVIAGVAVLAGGRRQPSRVAAAPLISPQVWGLGLHGRF